VGRLREVCSGEAVLNAGGSASGATAVGSDAAGTSVSPRGARVVRVTRMREVVVVRVGRMREVVVKLC